MTEQASRDETIWRYMDLARFVSLLSTGEMRFTRASTYKDDPWEGYCEVMVPEIPEELLKESTGHQVYKVASQFTAKEFLNAGDRLYVNCWCRWRESMPMWDLYGARGTGVAITSSPARLIQAVETGDTRREQWAHNHMNYHDDIRSAEAVRRDLREHALQSGPLWQSILDLSFQKRAGFEAENEWRATLYQPEQQTASGVDMTCDLASLITEVLVGPRAEPFVVDVVKDLLSKYRLDKPVRHSNLLQAPIRPV
jgi:hypothetical protein